MPIEVDPEMAINDSDTKRESFWGSTGIATQVRHELPSSIAANSMNMSVARSADDGNTAAPQS